MAGWGAAIEAAIGLYGQHRSQGQLRNTQDRIQGMAEPNPGRGVGPFGSGGFDTWGGGNFFANEDPGMAAMRANIDAGSNWMLGGGMFNNQDFQNAFQGNDIAGAMANANNQLGMQAGPNAFGNFGQHVQGLFGQGFQNLQNAGDTQGMMQQQLDASRAMAKPFETQARNNFFDTEFGRTMGGTSGASGRMGSFGDSMFRADQNRIMGAQQMGQQHQQMLGNLGMQQIGQGFQGEGQGFQQMMQALQQNQGAGQQRLSNAMGLFGMGRDTQQQQFGMGLQGQQANINQNQFWSNMMLGLLNADANMVGARTGASNAMAQLGSNQAASTGGFMGGMGSMFGGMNFGGQ